MTISKPALQGCLMLAASTMAMMGSAAAGEIRGQIFDQATQSSLPGAQIRLEGTPLTATTDGDGSFIIRNVAPGAYRLIVAYVGYPAASQSVSVADTAPANVQIALGSIETVTVTGQRQAERVALQRKQSADNLIETLNSNDVGKLPDQNVAEAVRRLPGISVANDQGEGRYVIIRGAPPSLANVTVNGQTAPAPEPDGRQVKLDDIPASLVGSLTVVKSLTPDLDANAIAGQVDIDTLTAFDRKDSFIYGRLSAGHYDLSGKSPYEGDLTLGGKFGDDEQFGAVLSGNYSTRPIVSENFGSGGPTWATIGGRLVPSNMQIRDYTLTRERAGAVGNFDWHVTDDLKLFLRTTYSSFSDSEIRDRFTINLPTSAAGFSNQTAATGNFAGGRAMRYVRAREEDDHTLSVQGGGSWIDGLNKWDLQTTWSEAVKTDPRRNEWQFRTGSNIGGSYDLSNFLYIVNPDANAYDASRFPFNQLVHANRQAVEHLYQARLDFERPMEWGDNSSIKLGMKYLNRNKTNNQEQQTFTASGTAMTLANASYLGSKTATYDGRYTVGPRVDYTAAEAFFAAAHGTNACDTSTAGGFRCDVNASISASASGDYKVSEEVLAGYAMATLKFGALTVIPGVRVEDTRGTYGAKAVRLPSSGAPVVTPVSSDRSYTDVFPGVNARYDLSEDLVLRAAVTTAIGRPDYAQLPPFVTVDNTSNPVAVSSGNPALKPLYSTNLDAAIEYYLPGQGIISFGLFHKDIENPIYAQQLTVTGGTFGGIPVPGAANVASFANARSAHVQGVEFNIQSRFDFLPDPFDGLGASANITAIDSKAGGLPGRADMVPLFNQSKYVGTAQIFYEKYGVNLRLAYSYRSRYLDTLGGNIAGDQYTAGLGQLDARASYDLTDNIVIFAEAANLTDAPWRRYIGDPSQVYENERYSWSTKAGIQVKF